MYVKYGNTELHRSRLEGLTLDEAKERNPRVRIDLLKVLHEMVNGKPKPQTRTKRKK
jgi:hypothetical protein